MISDSRYREAGGQSEGDQQVIVREMQMEKQTQDGRTCSTWTGELEREREDPDQKDVGEREGKVSKREKKEREREEGRRKKESG